MAIGGGGSGGSRSASDVRAGGAWFEIYAKDGLSGVLDKLEAKVKRFAGSLRKIGGAIAGAGGALGAGPLGFLLGGISNANDIANLSRQFQVPVEMMAKLKYAADAAGASIEEVMKNPGLYADKLAEAPGMNADDIARAVEVQKEWRLTTVALQNAMLSVLDVVMPVVKMVAEFIRENASLIAVVGAVAVGMVVLGTGIAAVGAVIGAVLSPIGLVIAAGGALAYLFRDQLISIFKNFQGVFSDTFGGIADAVKAGNLELAFEILSLGIQAIWSKMILGLRKGWNDFSSWLIDTLRKNPWILPLVGGVVGGALGGPLGAGAGAAAGGAAALGIEALGDELKNALQVGTSSQESRVRDLEDQLHKLRGQAAGGVPNAPTLPQLFRAAEFVRGGFNVSGSGQGQFGYGEKAGIAIIQDIRDGKGGLPDAIGGKVGEVVSNLLEMK